MQNNDGEDEWYSGLEEVECIPRYLSADNNPEAAYHKDYYETEYGNASRFPIDKDFLYRISFF